VVHIGAEVKPGAKQTIALRLEGAVVDGLWLFHFAKAPAADFFWRCNSNLDFVELLRRLHLTEDVH
jgi:hypothetical protein